MESYIDFIKKYNNEKSISSSTDSEFDNFLKGGANVIKGGFPPVYSVENVSDSFKEYSPNLNVSSILDNKKDANPFLNVNNGGFLDLFKGTDEQSPETAPVVVEQVAVVQGTAEQGASESTVNTETTVVLPSNIEINTINDEEQLENVAEISENETSIALPNEIEVNTVQENNDESENTSIALPNEIEINTLEESEIKKVPATRVAGQAGGNNDVIDNIFLKQFSKNNKQNDEQVDLTTSVLLPEAIEIIYDLEGDVIGDGDIATESTVDLPTHVEVVNKNEETPATMEGGANTDVESDSVALPTHVEIVNENEETPVAMEGGANTESQDSEMITTSVNLPSKLEIVDYNQNGGEYDEDLTDTTFMNIDDIDIVTIEDPADNSDSIIDNIFFRKIK